ncbi:hypothetical protein ACJIZ3_016155 [Penstemon smallii]|uniref:RNA uridylyltransferase n=1 Tax=Penstemon smallii TaxID=265156 RepID=A0ABD3RPK3_9LAMI
MNGGGGDAPPSNGGDFILQLLRKQTTSHSPTPSPPQTFPNDPAVAAVGRTINTFPLPHAAFPTIAADFPYNPWTHSPPPFAPHNYFQQNPNPNPNLNPDFSSHSGGFNYASNQFNLQPSRTPQSENSRRLGFIGDNSKQHLAHQQEQNLVFGSLNRDVLQNRAGNHSHEGLGQGSNFGTSYIADNLGIDRRLNGIQINSVGIDGKVRGNGNNNGNQGQNGNSRMVVPPPGFPSKIKNVGDRDYDYGRRMYDQNLDKGKGNFGNLVKNNRLTSRPDSPEDGDTGKELDDLEDRLVDSLGLEDESSDKKKHPRDKDYRSDKRGQWIMGQRMRNQKIHTTYPNDINRLNAPFLTMFESLIPPNEEKVKQKQLLTVLEKLVSKEYPEARLFLYGSCANSFGFSKSDIDVCLAMELQNVDKSDILLKLADIFESNNLQNVQALTRARVPIVKLMDPVTGISCDICINNVLAVVNTKLLRDYAQIDERLRQLVFIVKHWAKSRQVNETYHGTLSSYAYVLMCIHFLQQRRPAILPCLQGMETTYFANVDNVECAYFDQVEKLHNYGSRNGESIAQLVWAFFHYWAYCHDYANDVISVRTGRTLSKRAKDWTRRVGNDRHLICIEDPFEVSHDLGRVVDKFSIRVLREEFERAAQIMHCDSNPCVTLFEPYVPN